MYTEYRKTSEECTMKYSNEKLVIGVLGGMGTYATIHLFRKYAEVFPAEKEWDRPRIIIDNRCTMPSRVRAFLYDENVDLLVGQMSESIRNLINAGCTRILLACNTSHLFLPEIINKVPVAQDVVLNIILNCARTWNMSDGNEVYLLASEGTIESGIYQKAFAQYRVNCVAPARNEYSILRECIEAVKQNCYCAEIEQSFLNIISRHKNCILGCTELPILADMLFT